MLKTELIAYAGAYGYFLMGRYEKSEQLINVYNLDDVVAGGLLKAEILFSRGQEADALQLMEAQYSKDPRNPDILTKLCNYHREAGSFDESRRYGLLLVVMQPAQYQARLLLMHTYHASGDEDALRREFDNFLRLFGDNEVAVTNLAFFASKYAEIDFMHQIYERALSHDFNMAQFTYHLVETYVMAKDYEGALENLKILTEEAPDWFADNPKFFSGVEAVAYYANEDDLKARALLDEFLKNDGASDLMLFNLYQLLTRLDRLSEANIVLEKASERFPDQTRLYLHKVK